MALRHERQTHILRGMVFDTHNFLGIGWPEDIYHQGFVEIANKRNVPVESKPQRYLYHRNYKIHKFEADIIAFDLIILELKALPFTGFSPVHFAQLAHYSKVWKKDLGLLVNFGGLRAEIERYVWNEPEWNAWVGIDAIQGLLNTSEKEEIHKLQNIIYGLGEQYGLGYPETVMREIVRIELIYCGFDCQFPVIVSVDFGGVVKNSHESSYLLLNNNYLVNVRALLVRPSKYDFAQMKTYLNHLGLQKGLIVNFGKKEIQIYGVNPESEVPKEIR